MANALWITLIGMGLVFIAILLLWGGMALLVRVTTEREPGETREGADEIVMPAQEAAVAPEDQADRRRRAAAAAVTVALALRKPSQRENQNGSRAGAPSAWQAVNRASQINQALSIPRKKVVR